VTPLGYNRIDRITAGDDWELDIEMTAIPAGQSLQTLTFTAREALAADPVISKPISIVVVAGNGRIIDDGSTTGIARALFEFPGAQTTLLAPGVEYLCDVEARSSAGKARTIRRSTLIAGAQITT
jgi:hypothetical protein